MESVSDVNTLAAVVVIGLAVWQAVEIWHHSVIMASPRARAEVWATGGGFKGWLGSLLVCPWCTSVWTGLILAAFYFAGSVLWLFVIALASSRLANAMNDHGYDWCRTPKTNTLPNDEEPKNQNLEVKP